MPCELSLFKWLKNSKSKSTGVQFDTVEAPISGHQREVKKCPQLELAAYRNV